MRPDLKEGQSEQDDCNKGCHRAARHLIPWLASWVAIAWALGDEREDACDYRRQTRKDGERSDEHVIPQERLARCRARCEQRIVREDSCSGGQLPPKKGKHSDADERVDRLKVDRAAAGRPVRVVHLCEA
eukprot:CAMPEP_0115843318 /NCGR_PEP_ID=MMETSP0287-20121206/8250_1 /TAXON_ID=412157 /ORGANISM="Chrysochromulina rotalis, Strain UIO044" /LENGTH=129 /DNA_ID=CAMNT_0003297007 /DNA_START=274 /DNA_END=663 /DNA_ORIENTATION=-